VNARTIFASGRIGRLKVSALVERSDRRRARAV